MTGFYLFFILIGSFITAIAMIYVFVLKNKEHDYSEQLKSRRDALVDTIDDAGELVAELDRFAEEIVTRCEKKQEEIREAVVTTDLLLSRAASACAVLESLEARVRAAQQLKMRESINKVDLDNKEVQENADSDKEAKEVEFRKQLGKAGLSHREKQAVKKAESQADMPPTSKNGRVLVLDDKRAEALRLAKKGIPHDDIARSLHIGKGEVELIARIKDMT